MRSQCALNNKGACCITIGAFFSIFLLFNSMSSSSTTSPLPGEDTLDKNDPSYGIIIDAGSTGSRLFLYSWLSHSDQGLIDIRSVNDDLGRHVVKKVSPGLSTFADDPKGAAEYIRPLLDYASQYIPKEKHSATPIFIFATAGMRLLPINKQEDIMQSLREKLPYLTKLQVLPQHIQVITGRWEGIYSWIAVNYILGRFNFPSSLATSATTLKTRKHDNLSSSPDSSDTDDRPKTVGMIDMGGASAQIAFELPPESEFSSESVQLVNLGAKDDDKRFLFKLFVTTFLGYGVNEGARKYEELLKDKLEVVLRSDNSTPPVPYVRDDCLPANLFKLVTAEDGTQFVRKGTGDWDSCVQKVVNLLLSVPNAKSCATALSCYFSGVKAPPISLSQVEMYGFSEYWFSVEDVLALGGVYDHNQFEAKAKGFCAQRWTNIQKKVRAKLYPNANPERLETQCFKSAWIHAILHNGFHVDDLQNKFQSAFKIGGQEVQWALGAMIYQMRYFPLRDSHRHRNDLARRMYPGAGGSIFSESMLLFYLVVIVVAVGLLYKFASVNYARAYRRRTNGGVRRNTSIWGYMMLSQQDQQLPV